jgi:putative holliday junction resolvase
MRYLAIDYGNKRTGLAICDPTQTIVSPLAVVQSDKGLLKKIAEIVKKESVEAIILGLPLNMDDSQGYQTKIVLGFAERLKAAVSIPVHLQDERLSSFAAQEKLSDAGFFGTEKSRRLDAIAAAEILQAFLNRNNPDYPAPAPLPEDDNINC